MSAGDFDDDIFARLDNSTGIYGGDFFAVLDDLTVGSDVDSGLATSPECTSVLSPDSILEEFIDCDRDASAACGGSGLQLSFGASTDSDGL